VGPDGQEWTNFEELSGAGQGYDIRELEPGLTGFRCQPQLGLSPVGYLVQTPAGNVLWDCPNFVDERVVARRAGRHLGLAPPFLRRDGRLVGSLRRRTDPLARR
jgi:hypothetical protein